MNKIELINELTAILKNKGFKKKENYWYKKIDDMMHYINIQRSQYDKNDYYCNVCIAVDGYNDLEYPKDYHSQIEHRIGVYDDLKEQRNPPLEYIVKFTDDYFSRHDTIDKIVQSFKGKVGSMQFDMKYGEFRKFCES